MLFNISVTNLGLAFPLVSFITCPTKNAKRFDLPLWYSSICAWLLDRILSIILSRTLLSDIWALSWVIYSLGSYLSSKALLNISLACLEEIVPLSNSSNICFNNVGFK